MKEFRFWMGINIQMYGVVYFVFALKPTIDAISALLFLGEYRKSGAAIMAKLRWCVEELLPSQPSAVHPGEGVGVNGTMSPMANTFSAAHFT